MSTLWDRITLLEGQTLATVNGHPFTVTRVGPEGVSVTPQSSGSPRTIRRERFEEAEQAGLATPHARPGEIRKVLNEADSFAIRHASYIAGVIRAAMQESKGSGGEAIPGVQLAWAADGTPSVAISLVGLGATLTGTAGEATASDVLHDGTLSLPLAAAQRLRDDLERVLGTTSDRGPEGRPQ